MFGVKYFLRTMENLMREFEEELFFEKSITYHKNKTGDQNESY